VLFVVFNPMGEHDAQFGQVVMFDLRFLMCVPGVLMMVFFLLR